MKPSRARLPGLPALALLTLLAGLALGGCGSNTGPRASTPTTSSTSSVSSATSSTSPGQLPGSGKPQITIGDKNFTEQFVLGELYRLALQAQGYDVAVDRNIGPTEVTLAALASGRIDLYPEYLSTWNTTVAGYSHHFGSARAALLAARRAAEPRGLRLLEPTAFSAMPAIALLPAYAQAHRLRALTDLRRVGGALALGAPPQFQQDPNGLPALQQRYGFTPIQFVPLEVGAQYSALDHGAVQAAVVSSTDAQLAGGGYRLLADPDRIFGYGNVVPVVSLRALRAEGPTLPRVIERVDRLLSLGVMRRLNADVDLRGQQPTAVATRFLKAHGLLGTASGSG